MNLKVKSKKINDFTYELAISAKWEDIKEDFKLDTVGEAVVGIKKVKYDGSIQDMYEKDYPKYIFYNAIDTALVYLIHEKIKTMEIALILILLFFIDINSIVLN